jgi:MFS transporter
MTPVALTFAVVETTGSAGDLGLVFAAFTLSHAVFILAGCVWSDRLERRLVMLACDLLRGVAQLIVVLAIYLLLFAPPLPTAVIALGSLASIFAIVLGNTLWETVLQSEVPQDVLSRVSSYDWAISLVFMPIGYAVWGPLSEWIGLDTTLIAAVTVVAATKLSLLLVPEIRQLRHPEVQQMTPVGEPG